ncbi:hypothetical protein BS78_03G142600, partial [Paspalum vaginatum]
HGGGGTSQSGGSGVEETPSRGARSSGRPSHTAREMGGERRASRGRPPSGGGGAIGLSEASDPCAAGGRGGGRGGGGVGCRCRRGRGGGAASEYAGADAREEGGGGGAGAGGGGGDGGRCTGGRRCLGDGGGVGIES